MKLLDWFREKLRTENLQKLNLSKKTVTNLIIVICLGLALILVADFYRDIRTESTAEEGVNVDNISGDAEAYVSTEPEYVRNLENELSSILAKIQGAGRVSVMITLKSSKEIIPAKDQSVSGKVTNEKDTSGGTRTIDERTTEDQVVFASGQGGNSKPLVIKELNPEVKGVIVVAEGAKDSEVKLMLSQAVQTVLDIPAYRVTVYERN